MSTFRKRFSRRDFVKVVSSTAFSVPFLAACADKAEETAAVETGGEETTLVEGARGMQWLPPEEPELKDITTSLTNPNFYTVAPWHMMNDYGYIEEEGFDSMEFLVSNEAFQGVVSKEITVSQVDVDETMVAMNEGVPIVAIATHRDHEWHMFGLAPGITKPEDLIGKDAIMGTPGTRSFVQRQREIIAWSDGKVDPAVDMNPIVLSGGSDAYHQAIVSGQVAIGSQYIRHIKPLLDAGATFFIAGIFEFPQENMMVHADTVKESPRTIVNFLRAWLKSLNHWYDWNAKEDIKALMLEKHELELTQEFDDAWSGQVEMMAPNGMFRQIAMRFFLDNLKEFDVIGKDQNYGDFFDTSFLRQAQYELYGLAWPPQTPQDIFTKYNMPAGSF